MNTKPRAGQNQLGMWIISTGLARLVPGLGADQAEEAPDHRHRGHPDREHGQGADHVLAAGGLGGEVPLREAEPFDGIAVRHADRDWGEQKEGNLGAGEFALLLGEPLEDLAHARGCEDEDHEVGAVHWFTLQGAGLENGRGLWQ